MGCVRFMFEVVNDFHQMKHFSHPLQEPCCEVAGHFGIPIFLLKLKWRGNNLELVFPVHISSEKWWLGDCVLLERPIFQCLVLCLC